MVPGSKVVILLTATHFEVAVPELPSLVNRSFPDSPAGVEAFAEWLRPFWRRLSQGQHAPVFCVVGAAPLPNDHHSTISLKVHLSEPPLDSFEPFSASFRHISPFEQRQGVTRRSMAEAVRMCSGERL